MGGDDSTAAIFGNGIIITNTRTDAEARNNSVRENDNEQIIIR